jgi:hypothetical protein
LQGNAAAAPAMDAACSGAACSGARSIEDEEDEEDEVAIINMPRSSLAALTDRVTMWKNRGGLCDSQVRAVIQVLHASPTADKFFMSYLHDCPLALAFCKAIHSIHITITFIFHPNRSSFLLSTRK